MRGGLSGRVGCGVLIITICGGGVPCTLFFSGISGGAPSPTLTSGRGVGVSCDVVLPMLMASGAIERRRPSTLLALLLCLSGSGGGPAAESRSCDQRFSDVFDADSTLLMDRVSPDARWPNSRLPGRLFPGRRGRLAVSCNSRSLSSKANNV